LRKSALYGVIVLGNKAYLMNSCHVVVMTLFHTLRRVDLTASLKAIILRAFGQDIIWENMKNKISLFLLLIKNGFKANVVYSASMFLSMISSLTTFFIQIFIWYTLLKNGALFNVSFREMATYLVITTLITNLLDTNLGQQVTHRVQDGSIEMDLVKPISLKYTLFFDNIGSTLIMR